MEPYQVKLLMFNAVSQAARGQRRTARRGRGGGGHNPTQCIIIRAREEERVGGGRVGGRGCYAWAFSKS